MSDDIVAAHLAAALIQEIGIPKSTKGTEGTDETPARTAAKIAASIYFDCREAVIEERKKRQTSTPTAFGHY